jgi:hypothetical protein
MTSRQITRLAALQILLVVLGFFGLGIVLKMQGYPGQDLPIRWDGKATFLREYGLWLLTLQVVVVLLSLCACRRYHAAAGEASLAAGLGLALMLFGLFLHSMFHNHTRPFFIHKDESPPKAKVAKRFAAYDDAPTPAAAADVSRQPSPKP